MRLQIEKAYVAGLSSVPYCSEIILISGRLPVVDTYALAAMAKMTDSRLEICKNFFILHVVYRSISLIYLLR
jgi:hypothetical protein